jgi:glycosyltransferase involved in cell wall biosynthesis
MRQVVIELISIIVTTYNREDALDAVLRGLSRQTDRHFEVVVADDGSGLATATLVDQWRSRIGVPLAHVWQEQRGFRAPEIANRALLVSTGAYCIFLDGDCIPRPSFIASHRALAAPGWFVFGNRVLLSQPLTDKVLSERLEPELWPFRDFVLERVRRRINRIAPLIKLPLGPLRKRGTRRWESVRTCNLAVWRSDLDRVDGQDGSYCGWAPHDSDLAVRLIRSGTFRKDGRFATGVLHLSHAPFDRSRLAENQQKLKDVIKSDRVQAVRGLSVLRAEMQASASAAPMSAG